MQKAGRSEVLVLQRQEEAAAPSAGKPTMPAPQPVPGALDGVYAPFTPRSRPKNGEPDGL
ncbi:MULTISPECIES: hypothetical protein [unclassified Bradyrhizobium]|uniref:hypothetical protein n=1 Tax=unclassified Bradyrhizobium TaxID=2631580 RepID=UPI0024790699|nr:MULTISPECIES: hypothetical protein [unclassified Bradyrhizobium]WGS22838.1 hypothetical protein MTX22_14950 [Bradyrhizobium sp. ISRA463]WGS29829.1 hypothetical protein MTX19_12695 [Bradyrhizobium sp. ISRA464]